MSAKLVLAMFLVGGLAMAEGLYKSRIKVTDFPLGRTIFLSGEQIDWADAIQLHQELTDAIYGAVTEKPCKHGERLFYVEHPRTSQVVPVCAKDSLWAGTQGVTVWTAEEWKSHPRRGN